MDTSPLQSYLLTQLKNAEERLPLIHADGDSENLHQYRVSLRRFRSVLGLYIQECYALEAILKPLLKSTNALREIDVFVLGVDKKKYPHLLKNLKRYKSELYHKKWNAEAVRNHLNAVHRLIGDMEVLDLSLTDKMLITTALDRYEQSLDAKSRLTPDSPEEEVHHVRIMFKKARYALEFIEAAGLDDVGKKVKKCKKILEHFGDIQDAVNQLDLLKHYCKDHKSDECKALFEERKKELKALKKAL